MKLTDNEVKITFAYANDDIMMEIAFKQFIFRGYVELSDAEQIRSELTKAINKARQQESARAS